MKHSYILLRNNRESGPFSLSELQKQTLKPNDLIWVEGQSVAWLYPGEIPELLHAPADTEKNSAEQRQATEHTETGSAIKAKTIFPDYAEPVNVPANTAKKVVAETTATKHTENRSPVKAKTIFPDNTEAVTALANTAKNAVTETQVKENAGYEPVIEAKTIFPGDGGLVRKVFVSMPEKKGYVKNEDDEKEKPVLTIKEVKQDEIPQVEVKYSQPLDEIKEMYVKNLQQRKNKIAQKRNLKKWITNAAVVAGLLMAGLLAGQLFYNDDKGKTVTANNQQQQLLNKPASEPLNSIPEQSAQTVSLPAEENIQTATGFPLPSTENTSSQKDMIKLERNVTSLPAKKEVAEQQTSHENPVLNGERSAKVRQEKSEITKAVAVDLNPFVSVKSNDYKTAPFGGIKDLQLTVVNDSKYALDNVVVELQYLKLNSETVKIELIRFTSVAPNGSQTIAVPRSNRGVKVSYRIKKIESKDVDNAVAGL